MNVLDGCKSGGVLGVDCGLWVVGTLGHTHAHAHDGHDDDAMGGRYAGRKVGR